MTSLPRALPGDLAFVRAHDWVGGIICRLTGGCYSHVKVVLSAVTCIEAVPPTVRFGLLTGRETLVSIPYATDAERSAAVTRARSYVGRGYSYLSYVSDLLMFAGIPLELGWRGEVNCAQLAARAVGMGLDQIDAEPDPLYTLLTRPIRKDS